MLTRLSLIRAIPARAMPKKNFYAVVKGRVPGIYTSWAECSAQVSRYTGNVYAGFATREEAEAYMSAQGSRPMASPFPVDVGRSARSSQASSSVASSSSSTSSRGASEIVPNSYLTPERIDPTNLQTSTYSPLEGTNTRFSYSPIKSTSTWTSQSQPQDVSSSSENSLSSSKLIVYTDGACPGNGGANPIAGIGVFFGPNDPRNISRPLEGPKQTNQRAEMQAVLDALVATKDSTKELEIRTDSKYVVNGMDDWMHKWTDKKWEKVENADLWKKLKDARQERAGKTVFVHVRGHSGEPGNEEADKLAVEGAKRVTGTR